MHERISGKVIGLLIVAGIILFLGMYYFGITVVVFFWSNAIWRALGSMIVALFTGHARKKFWFAVIVAVQQLFMYWRGRETWTKALIAFVIVVLVVIMGWFGWHLLLLPLLMPIFSKNADRLFAKGYRTGNARWSGTRTWEHVRFLHRKISAFLRKHAL